jgi:hypothetical protein
MWLTSIFELKTILSSSQNEGDQFGDDAIRVLSNDGLEVVIDLTVLYRVSAVDAPRILKEIGGYRTRLRPRQAHYP